MKRGALLAVSLLLLTFGALAGGYDEVWRKASVLCMECVGLG